MVLVRPHHERIISYGVCLLLATGMFLLGYMTERTDHFRLLALLTFCFGMGYLLFRSSLSIPFLVLVGIFLRLMLAFMLPNLSDDVYRFIWDGQLLAAGLDPFEQLPSEIAASGVFPGGTSELLYEQLNSPDYFTVYPPLMQYIFFAAARISGDSIFYNVLFLRSIIIIAEIAVLYLFYRKDPGNRNLLFYALNPAVILEFTGNLHFESLMLFLIVACAWYFVSSPVRSGLSFGLAIAVKLVPLIFGPVLLFSQPLRKSLKFFGAASLALLLIFIPLFGQELVGGMQESLTLYFKKFEFNASIYYVIRAVGFWRFGYNDIAFIGPFLAWTSLILIIVISWRMRAYRNTDLLTAAGIILTVYLFMATTVHPWYVVTAAGLMVFSKYRYAAVWSYTVMFSYMGYTANGYELNELWLIMEYFIVLIVLLLDIRNEKSEYEV